MIALDVSTTSVVVTCTDCPHWYGFAWTPAAAEASAIVHEQNVHPDSFTIRNRDSNREAKRRARRAS